MRDRAVQEEAVARPAPAPTTREARWEFPSLVAVSSLAQVAVFATRLVASYRALELGASTFELGLAASAYGLLSLLLAVSIGRAVDRYGEPRFVGLGGVTLGAGVALTLLADSITLLIASQAMLGLGQLQWAVSGQSLVGSHGDAATRSSRFGYYGAGGSLGQLIGPIIGAQVVATGARGDGPALALVIPSAVMLLLSGALALAGRKRASARATSRGEPRVPAAQILGAPGMAVAMLSSVAVSLGTDVLVVFLPAYGESVGLPVAVVGTLLAIRGLAAVVVRIGTGAVVRAIGPDRTLLLSVAVPSLGLLAVPLTQSPEVLAVVMALIGAGLGLGHPMTLSWLSIAAPGGSRATAMAMRVSGNRLGQIVAPVILGAIAGPVGIGAIFVMLSAVLATVAALLVRSPLPRDVT